MKSIKPGRGPSMMSGFLGIFMICFGILWTVLAAMANPFFALFGVLWTGMAIAITVHNFKNATGKNRYSVYDIVDSSEEPDPFEMRFDSGATREGEGRARRFCPFCGEAVEESHKFCLNCGRKLP
jgi:hypothetical protein